MKGYEKSQAYEWDRTRHLMFAIAKSVGAKNIRKVQDIMKLPLIDDTGGKEVRSRLIERLKEFRKENGG
jgi:hypothetical protein